MIDYISIINKCLSDNKDLICVEIIESAGSTPRTKGTLMIVDKDGNVHGTIGGGTLEFYAINDAKDYLNKAQTIEREYNLNSEDGMICGGYNKLRFTYLSPKTDNKDFLDRITELTKDNTICYVFGAGHVGANVSKILNYIGLKVVCYDDRKEYANVENLGKNIDVVCASYDNILTNVHITKDDFVLIMTNTHITDYIVEKQVLNTDAYYIGCMGSYHRSKILKDMLSKDGFSNEQIDRIHTPIGIQVSAETPEEIAISCACEVILYKSKKENRKKYRDKHTIMELLNENKIC